MDKGGREGGRVGWASAFRGLRGSWKKDCFLFVVGCAEVRIFCCAVVGAVVGALVGAMFVDERQ